MKIHVGFPTSVEAYNASQQCEEISDGDILVTNDGRVAVLVQAWPTQLAASPEGGEFHRLSVNDAWENVARGKYVESARVARMICTAKHPSHPPFPFEL